MSYNKAMNPNSVEGPKFDISHAPINFESTQGDQGETLPTQEGAVGKRPPAPTQLQSTATVPATLPPAQSLPILVQPSDDSRGDDTSDSAAEIDRIEKVWIDKAKSIVAKTSDDPFAQKSAISKVKAEYIKKRFNKTVPTDDSAAK